MKKSHALTREVPVGLPDLVMHHKYRKSLKNSDFLLLVVKYRPTHRTTQQDHLQVSDHGEKL